MAIRVGVFQKSYYGSADAADHVRDQLNNNTTYDFEASVITAGININTEAKLNNYDVIILGDDGSVESVPEWNVAANALNTWVSNGGGLVTTSWCSSYVSGYPYVIDPLFSAIIPIEFDGYLDTQTTIEIDNHTHPITKGISNFSIATVQQDCGTIKTGATTLASSSTAGRTTSTVTTWHFGKGTVVCLTPLYLGSRTAYGTDLNLLEAGDADKLLGQTTYYAATAMLRD